jgi:hypothetical protein
MGAGFLAELQEIRRRIRTFGEHDMIHVHITFVSGTDVHLDVDKDILIGDFIELAKSIGGEVRNLEFLL